MSCNGCRVLRKGCNEQCILRPCLEWIESPTAQGNATLFLSKFFGRSDLMSLVASVPENKRSALFQSLLLEACGRTVNPVNGAVGLLTSGNWHICTAAAATVLAGGIPTPMVSEGMTARAATNRGPTSYRPSTYMHGRSAIAYNKVRDDATPNNVSVGSGVTEMSPAENGVNEVRGNQEPELLNLFI